MPKIILSISLLLLFACEKDDTLRIQSFSYACKHSGIQSGQSEVLYQFTGSGFLKITQTNIAFNCGLDSIVASLSYKDTVIWISKTVYMGTPAYCNCGYDLEYTIGPLAPKNYLILIEGSSGISVSVPYSPVNYRR